MMKRTLSGLMFCALLAAASPASLAADAGQTSDEQGVMVTVTPPDFLARSKTWNFDVSLQTHTRDLNDDLAKAAVLVTDGKRFDPVAWQGAPPGGHHRKGRLSFTAITPRPQSVELQIRLRGEARARTFRWELKGDGNGN